MMDLMEIQKIEYQITIDLWAWLQKWIKKCPLDIDAWKIAYAEASEIALKYKEYDEKSINTEVSSRLDRLEYIDKAMKGVENGYGLVERY